jgi:mycofactocin precursor
VDSNPWSKKSESATYSSSVWEVTGGRPAPAEPNLGPRPLGARRGTNADICHRMPPLDIVAVSGQGDISPDDPTRTLSERGNPVQDTREPLDGAAVAAIDGLDPSAEVSEDGIVDEILVEDISIDGMCGVY